MEVESVLSVTVLSVTVLSVTVLSVTVLSPRCTTCYAFHDVAGHLRPICASNIYTDTFR